MVFEKLISTRVGYNVCSLLLGCASFGMAYRILNLTSPHGKVLPDGHVVTKADMDRKRHN